MSPLVDGGIKGPAVRPWGRPAGLDLDAVETGAMLGMLEGCAVGVVWAVFL